MGGMYLTICSYSVLTYLVSYLLNDLSMNPFDKCPTTTRQGNRSVKNLPPAGRGVIPAVNQIDFHPCCQGRNGKFFHDCLKQSWRVCRFGSGTSVDILKGTPNPRFKNGWLDEGIFPS